MDGEPLKYTNSEMRHIIHRRLDISVVCIGYNEYLISLIGGIVNVLRIRYCWPTFSLDAYKASRGPDVRKQRRLIWLP